MNVHGFMFGLTCSMRDGRQQSSELSNMNTLQGVHIFELYHALENSKNMPTLNFYPHFESSHPTLKFPLFESSMHTFHVLAQLKTFQPRFESSNPTLKLLTPL